MTTLGELKALARAELGDTGSTPLWPDERLTAWVREAIRAYGRALPRQASAEIASVAGQAAYDLPADCLVVRSVEHPVGCRRGEGRWAGAGGSYEVFEGRLALDPPPDGSGEPIMVRYLAAWPAPAVDGDALATPAADDDLLVMAVAARALRWLWTAEAKGLRYAHAAGLSQATQGLAADYERAFEAALARRGRSVRLGRLSALGP